MDNRKCACCKKYKPSDQFGKDKYRVDGFTVYCKECYRNKQKEQRNNMTEEQKEKRNAYKRALYNSKKEKLQSNRETRVKKRDIGYDKEKKALYYKEYRKTQRGKLARKAAALRRKARKMNNTPEEKILTNEQLEALYENSTHCPYCNVELSTVEVHLEHFVPLSKGGTHTLDNVLICCADCNRRKKDKNPIQWLMDNNISLTFFTEAGFISAYSKE